MGGFQRKHSPTGVEPGSPKVQFAGVTGQSRPSTNEEQWICYYFEAHACTCSVCLDPLEVAKADRQLCPKGHALAQDVADLLLYRRRDGGGVYSHLKGEREVRVEIPHNYGQTLSLLKAINWGVRNKNMFMSKPQSMDRSYLVAPRINSERTKENEFEGESPSLSMRRPFDTKLVEPKSPRPAPKPRRRERESTDDLIADSKRGSLYGKDMYELERAEKREKEIRYNVELREPNFKTSRRPHQIYT